MAFRREMETSIDKPDHKYLTVNSTSKNPYPRLQQHAELAESNEDLKLFGTRSPNHGTKSTRLNKLSEENGAPSCDTSEQLKNS